MKRNSWKGIPQADRAQVRDLLSSARQIGITPMGLYKSLLANREHGKRMAEETAKRDAEKMAQRMETRRGWDIERVQKAIEEIAILRDKLDGVTREGNSDAFIDDLPMMLAFIEKVGADMEESLFRLGIVKGCSASSVRKGQTEGWLKHDLIAKEFDVYNVYNKAAK